MTAFKKLKETQTLHDVADLLGYKPKALSYILYKIPNEEKYTEFLIPKKSGGVRKIKAPVAKLKHLQQRLATLLSKCLEEMCLHGKKTDKLSHGFRKKFTIMTNASRHKNKRHVFNTDLNDFFPSINFGRVRGFFISNDYFKLNPQVATIFAQIACHNNELPQGSPCSPVISNLIGHLLDIRMSLLASKAKCVYSRYADDLTFSTNYKDFSDLIAKKDGSDNVWIAGKALNKEIIKVGFTINDKKTSLQHKTRRQIVTGLVVNEKVNIKREYYKRARSMCYSLFQTDEFFIETTTPKKVPVAASSEPNSGETTSPGNIVTETVESPAVNKKGTLNQLEGILSYIYQVKSPHDKRESPVKRKTPSAIMKLYREFLFYKHFFALERPLVISEGKTDPIYMKCALRQLANEYKGLIQKTDNGYEYNISFLNFSKNLSEVFSIASGTSGLVDLLNFFDKYMHPFKGSGIKHPIIMLVDNDDGSKAIKNIITKLHNYDSTKQYTRFSKNLYVVFTPIGENGENAAIEDLFDKETLEIKVDGKKFNPAKKIDEKSEYGKIVFAKKVINEHQNEINFAGFKGILTPFQAVIEDYKKEKDKQPEAMEEPVKTELVKKKKKVK